MIKIESPIKFIYYIAYSKLSRKIGKNQSSVNYFTIFAFE